jgi:hypothetical protein
MNWLSKVFGQRQRREHRLERSRFRPALEALETREMPASRLGALVPTRALAADVYETNDTMATATRLGSASQTISNLTIHSTTDRDWFRFDLASTGTSTSNIRINFMHSAGDIDMALYNASGQLLARSESVSNLEQFNLNGYAAGTYYVQVYGYLGATNSYSLTYTAPTSSGLTADRFETNNTRATATNFGRLNGVQQWTGLSIHTTTDVDFYRFELTERGTSANSVRIDFTHASGNLTLRLLDAQGRVLRTSATTNNFETVSLNGYAAGTYYVQVVGVNGARNSYSMTIAAPGAAVPSPPPAPAPSPTPTPPPPSPSPSVNAWTIFVYVTASDLHQFAHQDINEMEVAAASLPSSVQIVVLWDQSARYTTYATGNGAQPGWGTAGRAIIAADTNMNRVATTFEILPELNTGHPNTLRDFLIWGSSVAPADNYSLILWNHGAGIHGFNYDDSDGVVSDNLTTAELAAALASAGVPRINVLAFDSCLMAMAEVGHGVRNLVDFVVASEELVDGPGHDYRTLFNVLRTNPSSVTAAQLATGYVASFQAQYVNGSNTLDTHSAVRASSYDALTTALLAFTQAAANASSADISALRTARNGAVTYDDPTFRDLGSFMQRVVNNTAISSNIRSAAQNVLSVLNNMVVAKTTDRRGSSGIAIYLPAGSPQSFYNTQYAAFNAATGWYGFLQRIA